MNYAELVKLYFERSNALQWYWTIYVLVIGGLLAFSSLRKREDLLTALLVTLLYALFAYKNLGAIHDVTDQRTAVRSAIGEYAPGSAEAAEVQRLRPGLEPTLDAPAYGGIRNFHVTCDVLTIAALWAMEWRRRRLSNESRKTAVRAE